MNFAIKSAKEMVEHYGTSDLEEICKVMNINIIKYDLPESVEGFFQNFHGVYIVYINENLEEMRKKFVLGHEIGHIMMHDCVNTLFMKENSYFNIEKCEKEANIFSAYMIMETSEYDIEWAMNYFELTKEDLQMINEAKGESYVLL